jgi:hypothetical protein
MAEGDPSPGSPYTFDLARMWLSHCKEHHSCGEPLLFTDQKKPLPSRLLDLDEFSEDIKLVEAREIDESKDYTALSHCWGVNGLPDSSKLTTVNVDDCFSQIQFSSLPLNFQHAITITRKLGMRYLWVDALCILQDSREDWHNEAAKMATTYSGAAVTIAASIGDDANRGCFTTVERPKTMEESFVAGICTFEPENPIVIRNTLSTGDVSTIHFYPRTWPQKLDQWFQGGPLADRGWTLQENMMSPRILHFTRGGLFWECREEYRSEEGYHCIQSKISTDHMTTSKLVHFFTMGRNEDTRSDRKMFSYSLWYNRIVPNYTNRKLTFTSDKLAATSSIARSMQWQTGWTYLVGLWSRRIAWGLTWEAKDFRGNISVSKQRQKRYPSWTWVSHDFEVHWPTLIEDEENKELGWKASIFGVDWTIESDEGDCFLSVSKAELKITAPINTGWLRSKGSQNGYRDEHIEGRRWFGATFTILRSFEYHLDDDIPPQKINFLQLLNKKNKAGHSYCCLLLVPTDNSKRKYKRVGIGNGYAHDAVSDKDKFHFFNDFKTETVILV